MLKHRTQVQKYKLFHKFEIYDPNLSECDNIQVNGYNRI